VLRIYESEAQVMQRVVDGLIPTQHARFIFQTPPTSFLQLERLVIVGRNIAYRDRLRVEPDPEVMIVVAESPVDEYKSGGSGNKRSREPRQRKAVVCFYFRRPRHMQSRCFLLLSQKGKLEHAGESSRP